jgi:hypothetical protein
MKIDVTEIPVSNLISLMHQIEKLIESENKEFDVFMKEFDKLKKLYKAGPNSKK